MDLATETMVVCFDERYATYGFEMLNELEHAWAMTVHKSQGSEYRAVILSVGKAGPMLLTRSVLYTAVTRGKSLLIAVGEEDTAHRMIDGTAACAPACAESAGRRHEAVERSARSAVSAAVCVLPPACGKQRGHDMRRLP